MNLKKLVTYLPSFFKTDTDSNIYKLFEGIEIERQNIIDTFADLILINDISYATNVTLTKLALNYGLVRGDTENDADLRSRIYNQMALRQTKCTVYDIIYWVEKVFAMEYLTDFSLSEQKANILYTSESALGTTNQANAIVLIKSICGVGISVSTTLPVEYFGVSDLSLSEYGSPAGFGYGEITS